jgi:cephalosporin-C deacetylase-like acetyl esterase
MIGIGKEVDIDGTVQWSRSWEHNAAQNPRMEMEMDVRHKSFNVYHVLYKSYSSSQTSPPKTS